jgi:immune inhibitor A
MRISRLVAAAAVSAVVLTPIVPAQANAPVKDTVKGASKVKGGNDNRLLPFQEKAAANKQAVLQEKVKGNVAANAKVVKIAKKRYVNLENEGTDRIFVVLADFGDTRHSAYPDTDPETGEPASDAQRFDGPLNNEIPKPDRKVDNSTLWQANYNKAHYQDMYFKRMKAYFERQSSGRYSVDGAVTDWVKVPFNEARYGRDSCGDIVCNNTWFLIRDAMAVWTKDQLDKGQTMAQIQAYLATFDKQDRYDLDGDGNFNEPDGFIDHFQIVHAGGDQAAADPTYGSDAIWSHRWYAAVSGGGPGGLPGVNIGQGGVSSGVTIPDNPTGVWVGDYTIQPENGGLGVFAHEFTHDLGMPDLYDTSGNTGGAENSTGFWTLMSSGANIGDGSKKGIGDAPTDLGAWERFQLGWLNAQGSKGPFYSVVLPGKNGRGVLGPNDAATDKSQALFVVLPDKHVPLELGAPYAGDQFYYSGSGDDLDNTMSVTTTLPADAETMTAQVRYDIEPDWDYAYAVVSEDDGATWTALDTNLSTDEDPNGQNLGHGITGDSGGDWTELTADISAYAGEEVTLGFRYWTDVAATYPGMSIDAISIPGVGTSGAEDGDPEWTFDGFRTTTGTEDQAFFNAYVAENRQYDRYDTSLKTAYNFGFTDSRPDWVESYPYQDGLLISYWDESYSDNNVGDHPGGGLIRPIDAHPQFSHSYDGQLVRPRTLTFDSTFSTHKTDRIVIHKNSQKTVIPSRKAVPTFDDRKTWWYDDDGDGVDNGRYQPGWFSVNVPKTGTTISIVGGWNHDQFLIVKVKRH